jgi:hypothetical protein
MHDEIIIYIKTCFMVLVVQTHFTTSIRLSLVYVGHVRYSQSVDINTQYTSRSRKGKPLRR